ncbi:hypothetical protein, partial [Macromonas bipunctata]|uniref:hypothetical protein n=1 Tax=Macromonas bipunctata TaxID=183670 RepID=UPI00197BE1CB
VLVVVFTPTMIRVGYTKDNRPSRPDRSNLGLNPEACRSIWVIGNMDASTQQNAALVEEMATAAERLKEQACELVTSVQVFRLDATTKG